RGRQRAAGAPRGGGRGGGLPPRRGRGRLGGRGRPAAGLPDRRAAAAGPPVPGAPLHLGEPLPRHRGRLPPAARRQGPRGARGGGPGGVLYLTPTAALGGAERVLLSVMAAVRESGPGAELRLLLPADGPLAERAAALGVGVRFLPLPPALA